MKWLVRLLSKDKEPDPEAEEREMQRLRRQAEHATTRALRLERELRRVERAPWR